YGLGVQRHINENSSRDVNLSAVHASLNRLDEKGYVRSMLGAPSQSRGGKRKRLYELTPFGVKALADMKKLRDELWSQLSPEVLKLGTE
ncbi:MAG: PadR family transcriptional regulator, partial [Bacteroidota bacterium]